MSVDIVTELRVMAGLASPEHRTYLAGLFVRAADEIERLRKIDDQQTRMIQSIDPLYR